MTFLGINLGVNNKPNLRYSRKLYKKMTPDLLPGAKNHVRKLKFRQRGPLIWFLAAALTFTGGVTYWQTAGKKKTQGKQTEYLMKELQNVIESVTQENESLPGPNQEQDSTTFVPKTLTWG